MGNRIFPAKKRQRCLRILKRQQADFVLIYYRTKSAPYCGGAFRIRRKIEE
ncbi:hypothetical protein FAEPRAA2165_01563 [Faecalibacterium duncaniae]|uniref:Uncharacterized protein n=1 Tax=Faecalibacterium duncaniae (strain DSM 17677 / JCM 31915 / A2-165) TaxID=411483 RepID=C7H5J2_FAED2|nr:hypothetical protein FAEPRAA2165_01563 [Faecalibacterium duncaniae]